MTAQPPPPRALRPRQVAPAPARSIPAYVELLRRGQLSRGRIFALMALGAIAVIIAIVSRSDPDPDGAAIFVIVDYGISVLVPIAALLLASPLLGNLVEDRLLAYLALKPAPRWHLAVAALLASTATLLPATVVPVASAAAITELWGLLPYAALAAGLGAHRHILVDAAILVDRCDIRLDPVMVTVLCPVLDDAGPGFALADGVPEILKGGRRHIGMTHDVVILADLFLLGKTRHLDKGPVGIGDLAF